MLTALTDPVNPGGLKSGEALKTAVLICLMTDCRVEQTELRDGDVNRGWPGDAFDLMPGETPLGSKLWLLRRSALRPGIETLAEDYALQALQPLIDQGAFVRFDVQASADPARNRLDLTVDGFGRDGVSRFHEKFAVLWDGVQ
ncbi:MAG: phage GP46 family protein [Proteobacteria bacterium]|nr:phage GP46 family protein [Pseudomonadota bacterium]